MKVCVQLLSHHLSFCCVSENTFTKEMFWFCVLCWFVSCRQTPLTNNLILRVAQRVEELNKLCETAATNYKSLSPSCKFSIKCNT